MKNVLLKVFAKFTGKQENTFVIVYFLVKRIRHRCLPVNFAKFLRTPLLIESLRWLDLHLHVHESSLDGSRLLQIFQTKDFLNVLAKFSRKYYQVRVSCELITCNFTKNCSFFTDTFLEIFQKFLSPDISQSTSGRLNLLFNIHILEANFPVTYYNYNSRNLANSI